jgi:hypothetical protein
MSRIRLIGVGRTVSTFRPKRHEADVDGVGHGNTSFSGGRVAILFVPGDGQPLLPADRGGDQQYERAWFRCGGG